MEPGWLVAIRPGALGDTLLTLPALAWARHNWPRTRIALAARAEVLPLALASGIADDVSSYDAAQWAALFGDTEPALKALRAELRGGAAIGWLRDEDGTVARNLAAAGAAPVAIAPGKPPPGSTEHAALQVARGLAGIRITPPPTLEALVEAMPSLRPADEDERAAAEMWRDLALPAAGVVAVHAGSGGAAKCWQAEGFIALLGRLAQVGSVPLLVEGPADGRVAAAVRAGLAALPVGQRDMRVVPVARGLTVGALAGVLRRCAAYVGNDSGVTHLAGLLGVPTVALFGPTDPAVWGPLGAQVRVVRAPTRDMRELRVEDVWRAAQRITRAEGSGW